MSIQLSDYEENINTECDENEQTLTIKAIRIDGKKGLKYKLGCGALKSCDYMKDEQDCCLLLEISDLKRQHDNLTKEHEQLTPRLSEKYKPEKIIQQELRIKYTDTLTILCQLEKQTSFKDKDKKVYLIALCTNSMADVVMFQKLGDNIKSNLKTLVAKVIILPASELENKLNNQLCCDEK